MPFMDFADVKPTIYSLLMVTIMASLGIVGFKIIFNRWPVPGVTDYVNAI